ncbi:hypothetical protein IAQ61_011887, partial [Plenodomus lingam]|uniref:uncharacterized protein n=1 Tax=Leptosphaeria maculans TaxID=5022 RepID=UPI003317B0D3
MMLLAGCPFEIYSTSGTDGKFLAVRCSLSTTSSLFQFVYLIQDPDFSLFQKPIFYTNNCISTPNMCFRVVEKFPVCGCIYHIHSIDRCAYYGRHEVIEKVVWVGSSCPAHGG